MRYIYLCFTIVLLAVTSSLTAQEFRERQPAYSSDMFRPRNPNQVQVDRYSDPYQQRRADAKRQSTSPPKTTIVRVRTIRNNKVVRTGHISLSDWNREVRIQRQ